MNRRFHIDQDRTFGPEKNSNGRWAATKLKMLKSFTVYEFVGNPSYQTPVFRGTKSECQDFIERMLNLN